MTALQPLRGVRVVEFAAAGPVPFCGMVLAQLGAEVTVVQRPISEEGPLSVPWELDRMAQGKHQLRRDLKDAAARADVRERMKQMDVLLEGHRPGTMERLGLGPEPLCAAHPRLLYCRVSGRGQTGPRALAAGHDLNFLAESGALHFMGRTEELPSPPLNLIADFGAGGMLAVVGVLAGLREVAASGRGQCIDVSMLHGCGLLMTSIASLAAAGLWRGRGHNVMDGSCPWYTTYATDHGGMVAVASVEPKYYAALIDALSLHEFRHDQLARDRWEALRSALARRFAEHSLSHWKARFQTVDACVSPVLDRLENGAATLLSEALRFSGYCGEGALKERG